MIRPITLICSWLCLTLLCGTALSQHKDHSKKGTDYELLKNIRLDVLKIESAGKKEVSVEGRVIQVSSFNLVTTEPVPFEEGTNPYNNVIKDLAIHYELLIGKDDRNIIHDKLIEILRSIAILPDAERDFSRVGLNSSKGQYLIWSGRASMPNYVWFDGKIIIVRFVKLAERRRDRAQDTETFWKRKIRFQSANEKLLPTAVPSSFAEDFLKTHAAGGFKRISQ